jgi:hypothetical protein
MTTIAAARDELVTAVGAVNPGVDPPACYVYSNGSDLTSLGKSALEWGFRVTCDVGLQGDDDNQSDALSALVLAKLTILQALAGWRILSVSADQIRTIAGGDHFTADIAVSTRVNI